METLQQLQQGELGAIAGGGVRDKADTHQPACLGRSTRGGGIKSARILIGTHPGGKVSA